MPNIERRDFLKLVGAGGVGVGAGYMLRESIKHPKENLIPHIVAPEEYSSGIATWYNSVCSMCSSGCGISVRTREGRAKKIEGNPLHPVSQGKLCAIGQSGLQVLYNPDRLTGPLVQNGVRGSDSFAQISWEEGLSSVANRLELLNAAGRGDRVAFLSEGMSGHLAQLLELFMEQMGSDRLLHYDFDHPHSLYAAHQQFFGEKLLPYYDLKNARYLLSFGADFLGSWISPVHHSIGFGHSREGLSGARGRFVQIEPRMSVTGAAADEWIAAKPGTEGILALGIAHHLVASGYYQGDDRNEWAVALADYSENVVAGKTGIPVETITRLADTFASSEPSLAIGGGSAGNHSNGVETLVAVNALNYLVGNLGKPGGLVFNPAAAGQASQPHQASLRDMLALAEDARQGQIEVLVINGVNPVFTMPNGTEFGEALAQIPLIVSLSSFMDETAALADVILPSHTYLESWGDSFPEPGVGIPTGSISQPVVAPLYNTKATGDTVLELSQRLSFNEAIPWHDMEGCLKEGWRKIFSQRGGRAQAGGFDLFWRELCKAGAWGEEARFEGTYALDKAVIAGIGVQDPEFSGSADDYPFILHPYLSMALHDGSAANLPWMQELPDPMTSVVYGSWVEINPSTAKKLGLVEGDLVDIESTEGSIRAPVYVYPAIMPDVVAMPIGQGHTKFGRYAENRGVNPIEILSSRVEEHSGGFASSATRIKITPTGDRVEIVKTGGNSRELGREIVQTTGESAGTSAKLNSIPITTVQT